jgi:hypothetical protein
MFSINHLATDEEWSALIRALAKDVLLISHLVHQQAKRILDNELEPPTTELSPREREVSPASASARTAPASPRRSRSRRTRSAPTSTPPATSSAP